MNAPLKPAPALSTRQIIEMFVRYVLGVGFALIAGTYIHGGFSELGRIELLNAAPDKVGHALSIFVIGLYTALIACFYIVRLQPLNSFPKIGPTIAALLGGYLMLALLFLNPREDLPLWASILSCGLIIFGNAFAIYVLTHLGRSFSILPESRRLVTTGIYSVVRHPLYLAEAIASIGIVIVFLSPLALAILAAQLGCQLVRMSYEEETLRSTFPEYENYAKQTARLLPGVY